MADPKDDIIYSVDPDDDDFDNSGWDVLLDSIKGNNDTPDDSTDSTDAE